MSGLGPGAAAAAAAWAAFFDDGAGCSRGIPADIVLLDGPAVEDEQAEPAAGEVLVELAAVVVIRLGFSCTNFLAHPFLATASPAHSRSSLAMTSARAPDVCAPQRSQSHWSSLTRSCGRFSGANSSKVLHQ